MATHKAKTPLIARLLRLSTKAVTFYLIALVALISYPQVLQPHLIYLNWVRVPWGVNWAGGAEEFGFRAGTVRTFHITTPDNVTLGAWHILPRRYASPVLPKDDIAIDMIEAETTQQRDARFLDALRSAENVFLYFHGNAGNRATGHRTDFYKIIQSLGTDSHIITVDYRGFGDSERHIPSETGVQTDAVAAFDWITNQGVSPKKVIIVGHSLGTGIATWLAHHKATHGVSGGGLVLLAAYASMPDAALGYPMVPLLWPFKHHPAIAEKVKEFVVERWESSRNIRATNGWPILIIHGSRDFEILPWQARKLFVEAVSARIGKQVGEPAEDVTTALAPEHTGKGIQKYDGYDIRPLPGREAWLWTSQKQSKDVTRTGDVWYLEVKHAGHNSLSKFQVVADTIEAWTSAIGF